MNPIFNRFMKNITITGDIENDFYNFLLENGHKKTADHCLRVGRKAEEIAITFGVDPMKAKIAGYLHDISAVFPNSERVDVARELGLEVLKEEEVFPMIIHQKISGAMAELIFNVQENDVNSAIACHTTLKANASELDKVLFVADKIEWDQDGTPPYLEKIEHYLKDSLDSASFVYIKFLFDNKEKLKVIHPYLESAYYDLQNKVILE